MDRFSPARPLYRVSRLGLPRSAVIARVAVDHLLPVRRDLELGHGVFTTKERVMEIFQAFRQDIALPPVEISTIARPKPYQLNHGAHRLYCSLAAGFSHIPAVGMEYTRRLYAAAARRHGERSMVQQWIDRTADLAYISVGVQIKAFDEFLDAIEMLISHPNWRPGMPVVEDLRQCHWVPPVSAIEEWRAYIVEHETRLGGSRWAVVTREDSPPIVTAILDAASQDAAPVGVKLKQFTDMVDAHLWVKGSASSHA